MSEFIREVEEELRRERLQKLWERYGGYLVGAALLIVLAVAGWRGWEWYQAREAAKSGARFDAAIELLDSGRRFEGEAALNALAKEGTAGYRLLARFRAAAEAGKTEAKAGVAAYDAIAADGAVDPVLRDLARLHAGLLLVDSASVSEIKARMEPLMAPTAPFRHSASELVAFAHYRAGEREAADKIFAQIMTDPDTPSAMRSRAEMMRELAHSSGVAPSPGAATQ
jgi:hypothetical protein